MATKNLGRGAARQSIRGWSGAGVTVLVHPGLDSLLIHCFLSTRPEMELDFPGSTPPILEGFGELLERFLEIFCYLLLIQASQWIFI